MAFSAIAAHGQGAVVLYEGARLIPGDGGPAINDAAILVDGGVIKRVGRSGALGGLWGSGVRVGRGAGRAPSVARSPRPLWAR